MGPVTAQVTEACRIGTGTFWVTSANTLPYFLVTCGYMNGPNQQSEGSSGVGVKMQIQA